MSDEWHRRAEDSIVKMKDTVSDLKAESPQESTFMLVLIEMLAVISSVGLATKYNTEQVAEAKEKVETCISKHAVEDGQKKLIFWIGKLAWTGIAALLVFVIKVGISIDDRTLVNTAILSENQIMMKSLDKRVDDHLQADMVIFKAMAKEVAAEVTEGK